jgi:hypothetical protein
MSNHALRNAQLLWLKAWHYRHESGKQLALLLLVRLRLLPLMSIYLLDGEVFAELMVSYLTGMYVVEAMQGTVKTLTRYATTTSVGNAQNKSLDRDNCKDNALGKAL